MSDWGKIPIAELKKRRSLQQNWDEILKTSFMVKLFENVFDDLQKIKATGARNSDVAVCKPIHIPTNALRIYF